MKVLVHAYFNEAKWFHENHIPTMEEYMPLALVTTGYSMLSTVSFIGMADMVTEQAFDWVFNRPKIVRASETWRYVLYQFLLQTYPTRGYKHIRHPNYFNLLFSFLMETNMRLKSPCKWKKI
jgi:hypothetical protein